MTDQTRTMLTKERNVNNGVLIIENIFTQNRYISDIIREIVVNTACFDSEHLVYPARRNTADCGSLPKEAIN